MDFHILTPTGPEHICSLVDGQVIIVPSPAPQPVEPAPEEQPA